MPIHVKVKRNRVQSIAVGGNLDWEGEWQLKNIGAVCRTKDWSKKHETDAWFTGKQHYEVPLPLIKRLFERITSFVDDLDYKPRSIGNTSGIERIENSFKPPYFMEDYRNYILPNNMDYLDEHNPDKAREIRLRCSNRWIEQDAVSLYKRIEVFEHYLDKIKGGDIATIDRMLSMHGIDDNFFARKPMPHQKGGIAFFLLSVMFGSGHICLFDEMRTGKTKQVIDISKYLFDNKLIKRVLIVVPNSIKYVWKKELAIDNPIAGMFSVIISGSKVEKAYLWRSPAYYYIVNYEGCRADKKELYEWEKRNAGQYLLVCDEAHKIKNPEAKQTEAIMGLNPKYSVFLTGTPVANRPEDCWTMTNFVCPAILGGNIYDFYEKFSVRGGSSGREIIRYEHLDEVRYRLGRISMRRLRKDVMFDQTIRQSRYGELEGEQKRVYEEMRDLLYTELMNDRGEMTALKVRNKLVQSLRLTQICDGYVSNSPGDVTWIKDSWKLKELDEFIEEYLDDIGKLVIWTRFVPMIKAISDRYAYKYGATFIKGQMGEQATENMYKFQEDPDCRIMVSQIQTSEGKGFQPATFCIFMDKWWSPSLNKQAEDRIVGIKNPVPVTSISLVSQDTIDERWEYLLERKKSWANAITGDDPEMAAIPQDMDKNTLLYLLAPAKDAEEYKRRIEEKLKNE
jgi:SNF2 family DNA or RNA helicase